MVTSRLYAAVTGTLTGYQFGASGYVGGSATDAMNWVWNPTYDYSSGTNNFSNWLMDGPVQGPLGSDFSNFIQFAYNYTNAPTPSFTSGVSYAGLDTYIDYQDPMVSSSITPIGVAGPVPGSGIAGLAALALAGLYVRTRRA
jgi:hypothetical protein